MNAYTTEQAAARFVDGLRAALGAENFARMQRLNADETAAGVCHSHDFVDANEVMAAARRRRRLHG